MCHTNGVPGNSPGRDGEPKMTDRIETLALTMERDQHAAEATYRGAQEDANRRRAEWHAVATQAEAAAIVAFAGMLSAADRKALAKGENVKARQKANTEPRTAFILATIGRAQAEAEGTPVPEKVAGNTEAEKVRTIASRFIDRAATGARIVERIEAAADEEAAVRMVAEFIGTDFEVEGRALKSRKARLAWARNAKPATPAEVFRKAAEAFARSKGATEYQARKLAAQAFAAVAAEARQKAEKASA